MCRHFTRYIVVTGTRKLSMSLRYVYASGLTQRPHRPFTEGYY